MGRETMEGAGGAQFDRFGGNGVGRGGNKIDRLIKLYYFSANLKNEIKPFDPSINHPIAEVLPGGLTSFMGGRRVQREGCEAGMKVGKLVGGWFASSRVV